MLLHRQEALKELTGQYGLKQDLAIRTLAIAQQVGVTSQPCNEDKATVTVSYKGNGKDQYEIEGGLPRISVAKTGKSKYDSRKATVTVPKEDKMPRKPAVVQETEPETNGERDLSVYLTKSLSPTIEDYITWLNDTFGDIGKLEPERLAFLSTRMYSEFQASDFNVERREARREQRAADAEQAAANRAQAKAGKAAGSEPEAEAPARGRGRPKGSGTTGPRAGSQPANQPPKRRGRPPKTAATSGAAPY